MTDPNMNGGYVNPPPKKRALRDPHADWWDKQERRNFGEPVHEDNDLLAVFSTEPYTHASPGKAGLHFMAFVAVTLGVIGTVYAFTPERPATFRTFENGHEWELGGPNTKKAREIDTDPAW
ncbi:MAG: hypothetical protein M1831_001735 [Alyxoria varia]|nr:MAG: hypothetical protein M1831_001735 [Alyxoria varia]